MWGKSRWQVGEIEGRGEVIVVDKGEGMWYDWGRWRARMKSLVRLRLEELGAERGVFEISGKEGIVAIGITLNAGKDIPRLMFEFSCGDFSFRKSDDPDGDLARWKKRIPGAKVILPKSRVKRVVPDWKHKNIYSVTTGKRIG